MATEFAQELDEQLTEAKLALQGQAQAMLDLLLQFEERLQERLAVAEARIAAMQADARHLRQAVDPRIGVSADNRSEL